jgi:hypothetical protein
MLTSRRRRVCAQLVEGVPIAVVQALFALRNGFTNVLVFSIALSAGMIVSALWRQGLRVCVYSMVTDTTAADDEDGEVEGEGEGEGEREGAGGRKTYGALTNPSSGEYTRIDD